MEPAPPLPPEEHTLNSADGKKFFLAVLTGYDAATGMVSVHKSNRGTAKLKIEMLSEENQGHVKEQTK